VAEDRMIRRQTPHDVLLAQAKELSRRSAIGEFGYQCRYCGVTGTDEVCVRAHEENCNRGDKS
jgi:hypothetical protein